MAHPLAYSAPPNSAAMARCRRFMSRFEPFSPYHGKSVECSLIFLTDNTCISEPCIMLQTMPHQILLSSPSNSARMTRYRWLGVPIHMYTDHTHTHTHTWFMNTHDTMIVWFSEIRDRTLKQQHTTGQGQNREKKKLITFPVDGSISVPPAVPASRSVGSLVCDQGD